MKNPIILALDIDDPDQAEQWCGWAKPYVGAIKMGPRLVLRASSAWLKKIANRVPIFLDFKFFDIPSTTLSAVRAAFDIGVRFVSVHSMVGAKTLNQLALLESELSGLGEYKVLAITVLTSFKQDDLPPNLANIPIQQQVEQLVSMGIQYGLTGWVCSAQELKTLRRSFPSAFFVTPGVRPKPESTSDDQARIISPLEALRLGADAIVIGRPILNAADPEAELRQLYNSLRGEFPSGFASIIGSG